LSITEDGKPPEGLEEDQKDGFLRELVPSSTADLFFFDGEKIDKLTDEDEGSEILGRTVKSLLGLHLVERLDTDLEVFISRRADEDDSEVSEELEEARQEVERLKERKEELEIAQKENQEALEEKVSAIETQRQRLKSEGGITPSAGTNWSGARKCWSRRSRLRRSTSKVLPTASCRLLWPHRCARRCGNAWRLSVSIRSGKPPSS
jgi:DNA sulfur modification protein DndD